MQTDDDIARFIFPLPPGLVQIAGPTDVAIVGPKETHKTSLLLQAAVEILTKNVDSTIIFIATSPMTRIPPHIHLMSKFNIEVGKRLFIYYFSNTDELIKFISQYYSKSSFPIAIMIDDLHQFVSPDFCQFMRPSSKSEVLSMILRNVQELTSWVRCQSGKPCYLLISSQEYIRSIPNLDSSEEKIDSPNKPIEEPETGVIERALNFYTSHVLNISADVLQRDLFYLTNERNSVKIEFEFSDYELYLMSASKKVKKLVENQ